MTFNAEVSGSKNHSVTQIVICVTEKHLRCNNGLILLLVEEEIVFRGVVGPNIFYRLIDVAFVFDLLKVFQYFQRGARANRVIDQFLFGCGLRCIFQFRC